MDFKNGQSIELCLSRGGGGSKGLESLINEYERCVQKPVLGLLDTREYTHTSIREHGLQVACTTIDGSTVVHTNERTVVYVRINRSTYTRMKVPVVHTSEWIYGDMSPQMEVL